MATRYLRRIAGGGKGKEVLEVTKISQPALRLTTHHRPALSAFHPSSTPTRDSTDAKKFDHKSGGTGIRSHEHGSLCCSTSYSTLRRGLSLRKTYLHEAMLQTKPNSRGWKTIAPFPVKYSSAKRHGWPARVAWSWSSITKVQVVRMAPSAHGQ